MGWQLALPGISRKTDKGLPRYRDNEESDVFLLSGAEDLVPVLDAGSGKRVMQTTRLARKNYDVHLYRHASKVCSPVDLVTRNRIHAGQGDGMRFGPRGIAAACAHAQPGRSSRPAP